MNSKKTDIRRGGCACGKARFEVDLTNQHTTNCHCLDCRRHIGAAYATFTSVPVAQFRWLEEPVGVIALSDRAVRRFCDKCGTYLKWESDAQADYAEFNTFSLDDVKDLVPTAEIYTITRMDGVLPVQGASQFDYGSND